MFPHDTRLICTFRRRFMSVSILEIVTRCMIISEMRRSKLCHFPRATRVEYIPTGLRWYNLKQTIVSHRHNEFTYTYLQCAHEACIMYLVPLGAPEPKYVRPEGGLWERSWFGSWRLTFRVTFPDMGRTCLLRAVTWERQQ